MLFAAGQPSANAIMQLSAQELNQQDARGRISILTKLRASHCDGSGCERSIAGQRTPMKPPILLAPLDQSDLVSIVQSYDELDQLTLSSIYHNSQSRQNSVKRYKVN